MRAAVFIGGDGPVPGEVAGGLGSFDLAIAADSGLLLAESWGVVPDWIVGDMDSLGDLDRLLPYPPERVLSCSRDKDDTDTELALKLASEQGCDETILIGGGGGRLDHLMALLALFDRREAPVRWVTRLEDIVLVDALRRGDHTRDTAPGATVSIFPVGEGPWRVESRGLLWPLDDLTWNRGFFGISNRTVGAGFSLRATSGRFLSVLNREVPSAPSEGLGQA